MSSRTNELKLPVFRIAACTTGHITAEDDRLMANTGEGSGYVPFIGPSPNGWVLYVPAPQEMENICRGMVQEGFSEAIPRLLRLAAVQNCRYLMLDAIEKQVPGLESFDW